MVSSQDSRHTSSLMIHSTWALSLYPPTVRTTQACPPWSGEPISALTAVHISLFSATHGCMFTSLEMSALAVELPGHQLLCFMHALTWSCVWHRFAENPYAAQNTTGSNGTAIYFLDHFYDNVFVRRKGVTSLSWAKPKLKFKFNKKVIAVFQVQLRLHSSMRRCDMQ